MSHDGFLYACQSFSVRVLPFPNHGLGRTANAGNPFASFSATSKERKRNGHRRTCLTAAEGKNPVRTPTSPATQGRSSLGPDGPQNIPPGLWKHPSLVGKGRRDKAVPRSVRFFCTLRNLASHLLLHFFPSPFRVSVAL